MRRKDKEIKDSSIVENILSSAQICRIGFAENNTPYIVPVNYGYEANRLFIHSAKSGKKIELIRKNPNVCFEIELDPEIITGKKACDWTTKYQSIIGYGKIEILEDKAQKIKGLDTIMKQHAYKGKTEYKESLLDKMVILVIHIEKLTAKQSGKWN